MFRRVLVALSESPRLQRAVLSRAAARRAAARFVAGDTLPEAVAVARELNGRRLRGTLNCLGEMTTTREEARAAAQVYHQLLQTIGAEGLESNISVKLTQLGIDHDPGSCEELMRDLLVAAQQRNNFVRIDMESAAYVDRTLDLYRRLRHAGFDNVGIVLQSSLRRTAGDLEALLSLHPRIRLVKGAYAEPASIAYPRKADVDANYRRLCERLLQSTPMPAIATHDQRLIDYAKMYAQAHAIRPGSFEFQMIYGVRRDLQEQIAGEGYPMRVYVPFGTQWFPYFMRRLAERPANVLFVVRAILLEARGRGRRVP